MSQAIRTKLESKLEIKESDMPQEQKIIVIHNGTMNEYELNELNSNLFTLMFNFNYHSSSTIDELLKRFQCVVIDVSNKDNRLYYSQSQAIIANMKNINVVFQARRGREIDFDAIKAEWKANFIIKYLPKVYKDSQDFLMKLLNNHVGCIHSGLIDQMKSFVLKKLDCIFG
jgi:hypothetical protein